MRSLTMTRISPKRPWCSIICLSAMAVGKPRFSTQSILGDQQCGDESSKLIAGAVRKGRSQRRNRPSYRQDHSAGEGALRGNEPAMVGQRVQRHGRHIRFFGRTPYLQPTTTSFRIDGPGPLIEVVHEAELFSMSCAEINRERRL